MNEATIGLAKLDLEGAQAAAKAARAAFIATLPVATPEQMRCVVIAAREVQCPAADVLVASKLNREFRVSEEQQDQIAAAKAEHRVIINDDVIRNEAAEQVRTSYLRSYKLRMRKDGRVTLSVTGILK